MLNFIWAVWHFALCWYFWKRHDLNSWTASPTDMYWSQVPCRKGRSSFKALLELVAIDALSAVDHVDQMDMNRKEWTERMHTVFPLQIARRKFKESVSSSSLPKISKLLHSVHFLADYKCFFRLVVDSSSVTFQDKSACAWARQYLLAWLNFNLFRKKWWSSRTVLLRLKFFTSFKPPHSQVRLTESSGRCCSECDCSMTHDVIWKFMPSHWNATVSALHRYPKRENSYLLPQPLFIEHIVPSQF